MLFSRKGCSVQLPADVAAVGPPAYSLSRHAAVAPIRDADQHHVPVPGIRQGAEPQEFGVA